MVVANMGWVLDCDVGPLLVNCLVSIFATALAEGRWKEEELGLPNKVLLHLSQCST